MQSNTIIRQAIYKQPSKQDSRRAFHNTFACPSKTQKEVYDQGMTKMQQGYLLLYNAIINN